MRNNYPLFVSTNIKEFKRNYPLQIKSLVHRYKQIEKLIINKINREDINYLHEQQLKQSMIIYHCEEQGYIFNR